MRVIVPPTGNETIAMLKDTSLLAFVPVTNELFFQLQAIGARTFQVFPMLVAACLWYLALTSVLMVGQFYVERYFSGVRHRTGPGQGAGGGYRTWTLSSAAWPPPVTGDGTPMVKAEEVHKRFGNLEVLKGIDMEVLPGQVVVLSGRPARASRPSCAASTTWRRSTPAGCGSTGTWSATASRATSSMSCRRRRSPSRAEIGMVFQQFNLFPHMTALENVMRGALSGQEGVQGRGQDQGPASCWTRSGWPRRPRSTRPSCRAASSSGWPSPAPWPWTPS